MPEQFLIEHCSPTLAGLKTGNLFPVSTEPGEDIEKEKVYRFCAPSLFAVRIYRLFAFST